MPMSLGGESAGTSRGWAGEERPFAEDELSDGIIDPIPAEFSYLLRREAGEQLNNTVLCGCLVLLKVLRVASPNEDSVQERGVGESLTDQCLAEGMQAIGEHFSSLL